MVKMHTVPGICPHPVLKEAKVCCCSGRDDLKARPELRHEGVPFSVSEYLLNPPGSFGIRPDAPRQGFSRLRRHPNRRVQRPGGNLLSQMRPMAFDVLHQLHRENNK